MKLQKHNIKNIIGEMTLDEKVHLCVGGNGFQTLAIERLGIPSLNLYDGHNGIVLTQMLGTIIPKVIKEMPKNEGSLRFMSDGIIKILFSIGTVLGQDAIYELMRKNLSSEQLNKLGEDEKNFCISFMENIDKVFPKGLPTCFPSGMAMGATWNPKLIGQLAECVGMEAEHFDVDVLLGPNVNIHRDPLGGRNFESYSEDPYLSSRVTVDYIKGLQKRNVAACVKHYACNNQETNRHEINEIISRRALEEIYLPSFKAAINEAKSKTLMTAYNHVNGEACSENTFLIDDVLRNTWGFDGVVVSDWNGVYNQVPALLAGSDLEMPGPTDQSEIIAAVKDGTISMDIIDARVERMLELVINSKYFTDTLGSFDKEKSKNIAYQTAVESIVLLKNNDKTLPITDENAKVALFGKGAVNSLPTGEGSAGVSSDYVISTKQGLDEFFANVLHFNDDELTDERLDEISENNDYAIIHISKSTGEGKDLTDMNVSDADVELIKNVSSFFRTKGKRVIVMLNIPGPVETESWSENTDSILNIWYSGQELGRAVKDIISGQANPSGRLPITFPKRYLDTPTAHTFPGEHLRAVYGEDIFVGYRYYDYKDIEPAYEFGYGMSYTDFEYTNINIDKEKFDYDEDKITISFNIENVGNCAGHDTPQLYVEHINPRYKRPIRELKGFKKIYLEADEKKTIAFEIDKNAFAFYDTSKDEWVVQPGEYVVHIGKSSRDICLSQSVCAQGKNPYALSLETTIKEVYADEDSKALVAKHIPQELLNLPGIHIELIYHPELSLKEAWDKYFVPAFKGAGLTDDAINAKKDNLIKAFNQG